VSRNESKRLQNAGSNVLRKLRKANGRFPDNQQNSNEDYSYESLQYFAKINRFYYHIKMEFETD